MVYTHPVRQSWKVSIHCYSGVCRPFTHSLWSVVVLQFLVLKVLLQQHCLKFESLGVGVGGEWLSK